MKRFITIITVCLALLLIAGCTADNTGDVTVTAVPDATAAPVSDATAEPAAEATAEPKAELSVSELYADTVAGVEFPAQMIELDDDYFVNQFGFDLSTFDEYIFTMSENVLLAENIVIIKVKDAASVPEVKAKLEEYVSDQTTMLNSYIPEQGKVAQESVVGVQDKIVYMLMSSKVSDLKANLTNALK